MTTEMKTLPALARAVAAAALLAVGASAPAQPIMQPKVGDLSTSIPSGVGFGCATGLDWKMIDSWAQCVPPGPPAQPTPPFAGKVVTIQSYSPANFAFFNSLRIAGSAGGLVAEGLIRVGGGVRSACTIPSKGGSCVVGVDFGRTDGLTPSFGGGFYLTALEWLARSWSHYPNEDRPGSGHTGTVIWNADDSISVHILGTAAGAWACGVDGWLEYDHGTLSKAQLQAFGATTTTQLTRTKGSYMAQTSGGC